MSRRQIRLSFAPSSAKMPAAEEVSRMLPDSAEKPDDSTEREGTEACVGRPPVKRLKTSTTTRTQTSLSLERSSAAKPGTNECSSLQAIPEPEISSLLDLQSRLECKASDPSVQDFLGHLRSYEAWRGSPSPPHHARDAMLKGCYAIQGATESEGQK